MVFQLSGPGGSPLTLRSLSLLQNSIGAEAAQEAKMAAAPGQIHLSSAQNNEDGTCGRA